MPDLPRRKLLLSAFAAPLIFPRLFERGPDELTDIEGRPIQRAKDPDNMTDVEREHLITIDAPDSAAPGEPFKVTFSLPDHPMTAFHHVTILRIFVDRSQVCWLTLAPIWQRPDVTLTLTLPKDSLIEAVAECNRHGLWAASRYITIAPLDATEAPDTTEAPDATDAPDATKATDATEATDSILTVPEPAE